MESCKRKPPRRRHARTPWLISPSLALLAGAAALIIVADNVQGLEYGERASPGARQPYPYGYGYNSSNYSSARTQRPRAPQTSSGGGFFGALFGGGGSSRSRNRGRYGSHGMLPDDSAFGLNFWSDTYPSDMRSYGRYRTLCVRTCDGYYWPVSFSTTRSGIARDANQCKSSCQAPAKLFYHRNPGADVKHMVDLQGMPYSGMENAYRYRQEYVKNCRCKPEPWSEAAKEIYQQRAAQAQNPQQVKTLANATDMNSAPIKTSQGRGDPATAYPGGFYPRPAPSRRARARYRANDPAHEGRWWAGSW